MYNAWIIEHVTWKYLILIFIGGSLELEDELFVQVKPGLSSFADNPKKVNHKKKNYFKLFC